MPGARGLEQNRAVPANAGTHLSPNELLKNGSRLSPGVVPQFECNIKNCHSGTAPTGPRLARPEDRLRVGPGIQEHKSFQRLQEPVFMDSGLAGCARAPE